MNELLVYRRKRYETYPYIKKSNVIRLCNMAVKAFKLQQSLIHIEKKNLPILICADLHGQFFDLKTILKECGTIPTQTWLFLGDYVDRGKYGVEVICLLLAYKIYYPDKCYMLRGNHEDFNTTMVYGFFDECLNKYGDDDRHQVWYSFINVFNHMPIAALVGERILAMHGGISPYLKSLSDIEKIKRPTMIPMCGLTCDLVWSDPGAPNKGWSMSSRSISFSFDHSVIEEFCNKHKIDLIVRGHQINDEWRSRGYFFTAENNRLVTIFSAPNYIGCKNTGAVLNVSNKMQIRFHLFRPEKKCKAVSPTDLT